jgi:hypothetical protein
MTRRPAKSDLGRDAEAAPSALPSRRWRRKHQSRLSRIRPGEEHLLWAPHRASWWISVLFTIGSLCFVIAPFQIYLDTVGARAVGVTFFVGSVFFTSAAALQWLEMVNTEYESHEAAGGSVRTFVWRPRGLDWWSCVIQLLGTLFFNATTFRGMTVTSDSSSYDHLVWQPDALGSICFLVSGYLAYVEVAGRALSRPPRTVEGSIVSVNLVGCIAFGASAVFGFVLPESGVAVNETLTNSTTSIGAVCFLIGALLLLPEGVKGADRVD